jgi:hypothetical protein
MAAATVERERRIPLGLIAGAALAIAAAFFAGRSWPSGSGSAAAGGAIQALSFQQVTDDSGIESGPSLSPDGASIAFTRVVGRGTDIFMQRVGGRTAIPSRS